MYYPDSTTPYEKAWDNWEKRIDRKKRHEWDEVPNRRLALCCGAKYVWPGEPLNEEFVGFQISENNLSPEYDTGEQRHVAVNTKAGILNVVNHYG